MIAIRVVLVQMPWGALDTPSLAVGILDSVARAAGHETEVCYANLDFADWAAQELGLGFDAYDFFSDRSYFVGLGDWVFSGPLYAEGPSYAEGPGAADGAAADFAPEYLDYLGRNGVTPERLALAKSVRLRASDFIAVLADRLAALEPDVVGFTTTFQQNTASLAAARALKQRRPQASVVFGGANCDGPQGAALHRAFPFVDFVVRGEGELAFPALLSALEDVGRAPLADIPGLCFRATDGTSVANAMSAKPLPPAAMARPNHDAYFDRLQDSAAAGWVEPKLVVEGARGCWWGEKHHCTFCGLNGSSMQFRSKPPGEFVAEVLHLAQRHQVLDFLVVDNILDMAYFGTALPEIAATGYDLRLHFEIKANLRRDQFEVLRQSGVAQVQPGIENLSTRVLRIMDKGVTGCQNIRSLRDAQSAGVSVSWNYLYGFPGEAEEDYAPILDQMPALHHLDPPVGHSRIVIERFSPYFDQPELGFDLLRPATQYRHVYQLPEGELMDLAYCFMAPYRGIDDTVAERLGKAIAAWKAEQPDSSLTYDDLGDRIVLVNTRPAFDWKVLELSDPLETGLFRLLDRPRGRHGLAAAAAGDEATVTALLQRWTALGLLFHENEHLVHVATEADNQLLMRLQQRFARRADWWEPATAGVGSGDGDE